MQKPRWGAVLSNYKFNYKEESKDARWTERAAIIKQLDKFTCQWCGSQKDLQVHHTFYDKHRHYWEYHSEELITLCRVCHKAVKEQGVRVTREYLRGLRVGKKSKTTKKETTNLGKMPWEK
jgi:5-methylcytosine-specific restriction endonuclease McrA